MITLPLHGLRVFDLSQGVAGPCCTMMMAAHGAEVIKIEPPEGDWLRNGAMRVRGVAPAALAYNTGKRSIAFDLKQPAAQGLARRIAAACDVVVENFRPGVVNKLGLDAATLRALNPDLVYCSISGFGGNSVLRARPVIDHVAQAYSAWMSLNPDASGQPQRTRGIVLADQVTALYAWQAIAAALLGRFRFGGGAHLDISLVNAMAAFVAPRFMAHVLSDGKTVHNDFTPPTGEYNTRAGILVLAVLRPADVQVLLHALGCADLLADERFATPQARTANGAALRAAVGAVLAQRTAIEWEDQLAPQGIMACAVRDIAGFMASQAEQGLDVLEDVPHSGFGDLPVVRIPGAPEWAARATPVEAPRIGQHSRAILADFGCSAAEIDGAIAAGWVVAVN